MLNVEGLVGSGLTSVGQVKPLILTFELSTLHTIRDFIRNIQYIFFIDLDIIQIKYKSNYKLPVII